MKHPITEWLGGNSTIVIHRPVIRALKEAGAASPVETAMLLEHIVYKHRTTGAEWIILPYSEIDADLMIEERTARNYFNFLKDQGLIVTKRELQSYEGKISPFLMYQAQADKLAALLGFSEGGPEDFSGSEPERSRKTVPEKFAGSSSISQIEEGEEKTGSAKADKRSSKKAEKEEVDPEAAASLLSIWNEHRGQLPQAMPTEKRLKLLGQIAAALGEQAEPTIRAATLEVAADKWWKDHKYTLDNLLAGEKYIGKSEAWNARHPQNIRLTSPEPEMDLLDYFDSLAVGNRK